MERREQFIYIISGEGGSGKTELLKYFIQSYNKNRSILVINPKADDNYNKMGIKEITKLTDLEGKKGVFQYIPKKIIRKDKKGKIKIETYNEMLDRLFYMINMITTKGAIKQGKRVFNGLLVLDDATTLFQYGVNSHAQDTFSAQGQKDLDIICVFHGLSKIPIYIAGETDVFFILAQSGAKDTTSVKGKMNQLVLNTQKVVNFFDKHLIGEVNFKDKINPVQYQKLVLNEDKKVVGITKYDTKKTVELYKKYEKPQNAFY